jgi:hypothetical protein
MARPPAALQAQRVHRSSFLCGRSSAKGQREPKNEGATRGQDARNLHEGTALPRRAWVEPSRPTGGAEALENGADGSIALEVEEVS